MATKKQATTKLKKNVSKSANDIRVLLRKMLVYDRMLGCQCKQIKKLNKTDQIVRKLLLRYPKLTLADKIFTFKSHLKTCLFLVYFRH